MFYAVVSVKSDSDSDQHWCANACSPRGSLFLSFTTLHIYISYRFLLDINLIRSRHVNAETLGLTSYPFRTQTYRAFPSARRRAQETGSYHCILVYVGRDYCRLYSHLTGLLGAYYAAQVGIALKARGNPSRDVLFTLLGFLEKMKTDIGNVDAIEIEAASAAYVENFALKVFQSADNEDRRGAPTK